MKDFPTKDKRRQKRRSMEAKVLEKKQFRQRIIKNKKHKKEKYIYDGEEIPGTVYERVELYDFQEQVHAHEGGDVGDTLRDAGDGSVPRVDDEGRD